MDLDKCHALITGGSSGIGKALAVMLSGRGAHISLVARDAEKLQDAAAEAGKARVDRDQRVLTFSADVSDPLQVEETVCMIVRDQGPPDLLVTCAGVAHPGRFMELPAGVFERTMNVNYFGTLYTIRAALPSMIRVRRGRLVLISSGAGLMGIYGYTSYSPSKFALRGLAECLRGELRQHGVGVSIVYPPDTDTPQLEEENRTKPLETILITRAAKTRSSQSVARAIVEGVRKGHFVITPGPEMTLLYRFQGILAPLASKYFEYLIERRCSSRAQSR